MPSNPTASDVHVNRPEHAAQAVAMLCQEDSPVGHAARARLQRALDAYSSRHADSPWPYYLMILMLQADGQTDAARLALRAFEQVCTEPGWIQRARLLLAGTASPPAGTDR